MIGGAPSLTSMLDEEPRLQWRPMGSSPVTKSTAVPAGGSGPQHGTIGLRQTQCTEGVKRNDDRG